MTWKIRYREWLAAAVFSSTTPKHSTRKARRHVIDRHCLRFVWRPRQHNHEDDAGTKRRSMLRSVLTRSAATLCLWRSSSLFTAHAFTSTTRLLPSHSRVMGSFFSSQSSNMAGGDDKQKIGGRPLPDFSAFAFDPAASGTSKKRTRAASKSKGDVDDGAADTPIAKPSPAKKAKTKSPRTPKRSPKKASAAKTPGSSARKRTPKIEPGSLSPPRSRYYCNGPGRWYC